MFSRRIDDDLELRLPEEGDAEEMLSFFARNRDHLSPWFNDVAWTEELETVRTQLQKARRIFADRSETFCLVMYQQNLAGIVFNSSMDTQNRSSEITYLLGKEYEGKGIASKACRAMLRHVFDDLNVNRLVLTCAPNNERSKAMANRLGFTFEGTSRQSKWFHDHFQDECIFSLLAQEWRTMQQTA